MKRLVNFGVSDPLTLGMAHPVADRLERLGRARSTTWRSRCLALSAMSVIVFSTAPLSVAASEAKVNTGHVITVIPDMSETQLADLKSRVDSLTSGRSDKSVITDFMIQNNDRLVVNYDAEDKLINLRTGPGFGFKRAGAELKLMPKWLERCKTEKTSSTHLMRVTSSYGSSSVQCNEVPGSKPKAALETK